jgi:hypothetical protein
MAAAAITMTAQVVGFTSGAVINHRSEKKTLVHAYVGGINIRSLAPATN